MQMRIQDPSVVFSHKRLLVDDHVRKKLPAQVFDEVLNSRGGSRTAGASEMESFVITVNGFQPLTIITRCSILSVAAALDPPLNRSQLSVPNSSVEILKIQFLSAKWRALQLGKNHQLRNQQCQKKFDNSINESEKATNIGRNYCFAFS